jgi:predicted pPIWI-associating nuclease
VPDALSVLEQLTQDTVRLAAAVANCRKKRVPSEMVQPTARAVARAYFEHVRRELRIVQSRAGLTDEIDFVVQTILELSSGSQEKRVYNRQFKELAPYLSEATIDLMKSRGERRLILSEVEGAILETLGKMLPATAAAYEQALRDLQIGDRVSWRGPANEFREILREVIDHLAPDSVVMQAPGHRPEEGRTQPTQKQKVRFILRVRSSGSAAVTVAEGSLAAVEEAVAVLARSTYQRSNVSTHTATGGPEIRNLKRYVDALLGELLEIRA